MNPSEIMQVYRRNVLLLTIKSSALIFFLGIGGIVILAQFTQLTEVKAWAISIATGVLVTFKYTIPTSRQPRV